MNSRFGRAKTFLTKYYTNKLFGREGYDPVNKVSHEQTVWSGKDPFNKVSPKRRLCSRAKNLLTKLIGA